MLQHFYLSVPNADGVFMGKKASKNFEEYVSLYEFELFKNDDKKALFGLAKEQNAIERILENGEKFVNPVCESENYQDKKTKSIITIEKGIAVLLPSGNWKCKQKAKVRYMFASETEKVKFKKEEPAEEAKKQNKEKQEIPSTMRFCAHCGGKNNGIANFCISCGKPMPKIQPPVALPLPAKKTVSVAVPKLPLEPVPTPKPLLEPTQEQPLEPKPSSGYLRWFVISLVIIVLAVFGYMFFKSDEKPKNDKIDIDMVFVQGGTFVMGCTSEQGKKDCYKHENPAHTVVVNDFHIGKYEVTQRQWEQIMNSNPSNFKGDNLPVENVSWNDVQEFISKLNSITGKTYRLPTEAEWEYAARCGINSMYKYAGSNNIDEVAWYVINSGGKPQPVGSKKPNEWEIYDMNGNVWEWVSDWFGNYDTKAQTNPIGPALGPGRVRRGCGWSSEAKDCRISSRNADTPDLRRPGLGFRLAFSPVAQQTGTESGDKPQLINKPLEPINITNPDMFYIPVKGKNGFYKYISLEGENITESKYRSASVFQEERALVQYNNKDSSWGYINTQGKDAACCYTQGLSFREGVAWVVKNGEIVAINKEGDEVIHLTDDAISVWPFYENRALFAAAGEQSYVDKNGNIIGGEKSFADGNRFQENAASVKRDNNGKSGYINTDGNLIIDYRFDVARIFQNQMAVVNIDNEWVVINKQGELLFNRKFEDLISDGNIFRYKKNGKWGWLNSDGKEIIQPDYEDTPGFGGKNIAPVKSNGLWGYIDKKANFVIAPQFKEALPFYNNRAFVKFENNNWGTIDENGNIDLKTEYKILSSNYRNLANEGVPKDHRIMAVTPNIDCAKIKTNAEKMICSSKELAGYDKKIAELYKEDVKAFQEFIKKRNACSTVECLTELHLGQIYSYEL